LQSMWSKIALIFCAKYEEQKSNLKSYRA